MLHEILIRGTKINENCHIYSGRFIERFIFAVRQSLPFCRFNFHVCTHSCPFCAIQLNLFHRPRFTFHSWTPLKISHYIEYGACTPRFSPCILTFQHVIVPSIIMFIIIITMAGKIHCVTPSCAKVSTRFGNGNNSFRSINVRRNIFVES